MTTTIARDITPMRTAPDHRRAYLKAKAEFDDIIFHLSEAVDETARLPADQIGAEDVLLINAALRAMRRIVIT